MELNGAGARMLRKNALGMSRTGAGETEMERIDAGKKGVQKLIESSGAAVSNRIGSRHLHRPQ